MASGRVGAMSVDAAYSLQLGVVSLRKVSSGCITCTQFSTCTQFPKIILLAVVLKGYFGKVLDDTGDSRGNHGYESATKKEK